MMSNFYQASKIQRKILVVLSAELNAERWVLIVELSANIFGILSAELSSEQKYPLSAEFSAERAFLLNDSCSEYSKDPNKRVGPNKHVGYDQTSFH